MQVGDTIERHLKGWFHEWVTTDPKKIYALIETEEGCVRTVPMNQLRFVVMHPNE